jgi:hypothetical protein
MGGGTVGHNLKGTHTRTIPASFGVNWFSGFRGEDLNVIFYQNMVDEGTFVKVFVCLCLLFVECF